MDPSVSDEMVSTAIETEIHHLITLLDHHSCNQMVIDLLSHHLGLSIPNRDIDI